MSKANHGRRKENAAKARTAQETGIVGDLRVEYRPISGLIPYAKNARTHSEAQIGQIAASIREFGFTNPVLVDGDNGIIAGHCRVLAAQKLGMESIPCIELAHLTKTQRRAYILADNKLTLNAGWNDDLLKLELTDLKELDFNLDLIGFDGSELADVMYGKEINQPEFDESTADDVAMVTCPKCGHTFPK